jgi:hypothetical protein
LIAFSVNCLAILYLSNLGEEDVSWEIPRFNSVKENRIQAKAECASSEQ